MRSGFAIVAIGGSAGGLESLIQIVKRLPADIPASVFVTLHASETNPGLLNKILASRSTLPANYAEDGETIRPGRIYLAPPDRHLLLSRGRVFHGTGPKENRFRPAVDPMFRSAAAAYGRRVIGVILSGYLEDGVYGLLLIKQAGGGAVVQDPAEAMAASMPRAAIETVAVDHVVAASSMAELVTKMARERADGSLPDAERGRPKDVAVTGTDALTSGKSPGPPSGLTCPSCGGALWERSHGKLSRYNCHVGHSFSEEALLLDQRQALENALWGAVRSLEENSALYRRMSARARHAGHHESAARYETAADDAEKRSDLIRRVLLEPKRPGPAAPARPPRRERKRPRAGSRKRKR